ncbi:MAG: histidine kinase dimerization/phosphoacceptor domain -containing protein [Bacteroidales bacterium]|nr:histidine kinase dimerization/phosphoacceptor domain -containing protein [Bacteroidales bacterium]
MKPHETQVQKIGVYLEIAELIKDKLPQKSFSYLVSAFKGAILEKNDSLKAIVRMMMGDYYEGKNKFIQAHEQYLAATKNFQVSGDTAGEANALINIGRIHRNLKNHETSLNYLQQGAKLLNKTSDISLKGKLYEHMALTYQSMSDRETTIYYFNKALGLFQTARERKGELRLRNYIGSLSLDTNRIDEGLIFFNQLLQEADTSDNEFMGVLFTRIGHIYDKKGDYRTSLKYNLKALEFRQRGHAYISIGSSLINIAGDYYNLGNSESGKLYLDSGLNIAQRFGRKNMIESGYRHVYHFYLRHGNYKKAMDYYARYYAIHDDISRERNRNNIAILEANQKLQRVERSGKTIARRYEILSLKANYDDYQYIVLQVLMVIAGLSMFAFIYLWLYISRVRQQREELNDQLSDEIREREAANVQTRERERQYKFITDNSMDFITHMDSNRNRVYASPASVTVYGYEPEEIITKSSYDLTHPDYHAYSESKFSEMLESRSSQQFAYQALKKDGTIFWVESILNPLFDPINGDFKGVVGVTRDIQERKTKELEIMEGTKQKENLLKEIHHRVKNNFAILVSLINMQMSQTKNQEVLQSLTNLQLRIRTMSLVHEMLYRSTDFEKISFPGYLRSLASVIAGTYNRRDVELTVEADEVVLNIETSIPLGLIINEILSNTYKHAFPEGRAGKIGISFSIDPQTGINTLKLQDDGIGMPDGVKLDQFKTMGLQVVQILCSQIEANLIVTNNPGASFTIIFLTSVK